MMKTFFPMLLSLLLLTGCAAQNSTPDITDTPAATIATEAKPAAAVHSIQKTDDDGTVQRYAPGMPVHGFLSMEQDLLLFSGTDVTTLTLLNTVTMQITATCETGILLTPENSTVQLLENGISYFDSQTMETVVLDRNLREVRRIRGPEDLTGMPLLSRDSSTLYYCTASAIRALDVRSGISRILKESGYPVQGLSGLLLGDTVLQVSITDSDGEWRTLFLSAQTGQLLQECDGHIVPVTSDARFCVTLLDGAMQTLLFGSADSAPMVLHPRETEIDCYFLPDSFRAVTVCQMEANTCLDLYDLETGARTASLSLPGSLYPQIVSETEDGSIWFLGTQEETGLFRWDTNASAVQDDNQYSSAYYTRSDPDYDGLASCSLYAQELSAKYGVEILVYKDAVAVEPWDYHLEHEYQVPVLRRELERLDAHLGNFPGGFLQTLRDKFTTLKICIVRSAEGSPESGSPESVNGIQFLEGFDAYIVLAADHDTEYALYHELCHLMETVVLTESTAYDRWDNLNPQDFQYDNDYLANQSRDGSAWLKPGKEYFIDAYSMSYAKEDRARILEYAMTAGHEELFRSPNLQRKLQQLCTGIREAFGLENAAETFLWEQYLQESLSPNK